MAPTGVYSKISISNGTASTVRLCTIKSVLQPPAVCCNLRTADLKSDPEYVALSYAWKAPLLRTQPDETQHIIDCNGHDIAVSYNLFHALLRLGQPAYEGLFWIDAICIDQTNTEERSHQVDLMADVYRKAKQVIVWLGPEDQHAGPATSLIRALCRSPADELRSILPDTISTSAVQANLQPDLWEKHYWISLAHLFRRSWFFRAWVIQEVLLATAVSVIWGAEHEIKWNDLATISDFLCTTAWRYRFRDPAWLGFNAVMPQYNAPANLEAARRDLTKGDPLLRSLIRSRLHDCTVRLDKVYCLYGIARVHTPAGVHVPRANYELSEAQAYTETAINVLQGSQDLHILAYAEGAKFRQVRGLPSWVPDWSVKIQVGLGITGHDRYCAAGVLPKTAIEFPQPGILRLSAAPIADIIDCGEPKWEISATRTISESLALLKDLGDHYFTGELIMDVFWRTLLYDTNAERLCPANPELGLSFQSWLREHFSANSALVREYLSRQFSRQSTVAGDLALETQDQDSKIFEQAFSLRTLLRMFRTRNGLLGLGTECLAPGDSVWIVPGSRIPLILRKKGDTSTSTTSMLYELVGGAYLHGLMHGQALETGVPEGNGYRPMVFQSVDLQ